MYDPILHLSVIGPERSRTLLVLRRLAGYWLRDLHCSLLLCQTGTMVDCLQDRALLLLLAELSGPRLESGFFVTTDSPGMLVLFWDLLCSPARQLVLSSGGAISVTSSTNSDGRRLLPLLLLRSGAVPRSTRLLLVKTVHPCT